MNYEYPEDTTNITRGTLYQVLDPLTLKWSEIKKVEKMSFCFKTYLKRLIERKGIRIIIN